MALTVKHKLVSATADDPAYEIRPSHWNDDHAITGAPDGVVPVGGIIFWSGTIAAASALGPAWAVCDGTANAPGPDLRDKFIVGANQDVGGIAKTNIEGSLKQTGGVTGVQHSAHANLTHAGGAVADHT